MMHISLHSLWIFASATCMYILQETSQTNKKSCYFDLSMIK